MASDFVGHGIVKPNALSLHVNASDSSITSQAPKMKPEEAEALAFLLPLSGEYPNIENWFRSKVVPGLRTNTRTLLRVERQGKLVGLGIAKLEPDERKICTVRIAPSHFGRGMGLRIFDGLLHWLDVDRPHLTVSEAKLPAFERIFDWYGFNLTSIRHGIYVPHTSELAYNERAPSIALSPHASDVTGRSDV